MTKIDEMVGNLVGNLLVISRLPVEKVMSGNNKRYEYPYVCECNLCGNTCIKTYKYLTKTYKNMGNMHCGCRKIIRTHGMSDTGTYQSWEMMKQRCLNPKATKYEAYGGEGIKIEDSWMSFEKFYEDMGERPEGTTLDRIDNLKGYNKDNCRWVSRSVQQFNRKISSKNKSGCVGVNWDNYYSKWRAVIRCEDRIHFLGYYKSKEDAIAARKDAEIKYFGFNINDLL